MMEVQEDINLVHPKLLLVMVLQPYSLTGPLPPQAPRATQGFRYRTGSLSSPSGVGEQLLGTLEGSKSMKTDKVSIRREYHTVSHTLSKSATSTPLSSLPSVGDRSPSEGFPLRLIHLPPLPRATPQWYGKNNQKGLSWAV